jgi:cell division protein FtsL
MNSLKDHSATQASASAQPILAAKRRRQLYPFFFHMGPVALCTTSVLLIGLMAIVYLSQVGQAVAANHQLQALQAQQALLQRQDEDLAYQIAQEQSPEYIAAEAAKMGLVPVDPKNVQILIVKHMQAIPVHNDPIQP